MYKNLFVLLLLLLLITPSFALELKFKEDKVASSVNTIKLTNNNNSFNQGDYNYNLPEKVALAEAGLSGSSNGITVQCYNDNEQTWYLYVASNGFRNTNPAKLQETIPLTNFKWLSSYAGVWDNNNSKWIGSDSSMEMRNSLSTTDFVAFTGFEQRLYTSNSIDTNHKKLGTATGTDVQCLLGISIPAYQTAGTYEADLMFTLTQ
ncbi:MAG: hypothetical protein WC860_07570 [Candidatus Margulisiibacteriota bacterium]|jgi:hypothetical protein